MIKLLELRSEKKLSQREVAKIFNVSQGTYNNWENSRTQPSLEQLIALADFFEVSVDYLIGRTDCYHEHIEHTQNYNHKILLQLFDEYNKEEQEALLRILSHKKSK